MSEDAVALDRRTIRRTLRRYLAPSLVEEALRDLLGDRESVEVVDQAAKSDPELNDLDRARADRVLRRVGWIVR